MSYDASVFNVMIASPSDVGCERSIVKEVIYEWNVVHSEEKSMVLLPVGWESHTSPEIGDRAQAIINEQTVDKCDLLVGVFGTRIGSETGEYRSGTIEEIEKHIESGKPAMLYFSNQLGVSKSFEAEQYNELMKWKKHYKSRGLCESYDSDSDFKDKFSRQLQIKVNQHKIFQFRGEGINFGLGVEESGSNIPQLSDEAKFLLKKASHNQGTIRCYYLDNEPRIRIGGGKVGYVISNQNPRILAQWRAALRELKDAELLEDEGNEGQVFLITRRGYEVADMIEGIN